MKGEHVKLMGMIEKNNMGRVNRRKPVESFQPEQQFFSGVIDNSIIQHQKVISVELLGK